MKNEVTFDYNDFNNSTRRDTDCRKHGIATVRHDDLGFYIVGDMGCGKNGATVADALRHYLGGRELLAYSIHD
jgi:hypothetical protein